MSETQHGTVPYKYKRTFAKATEKIPEPDIDKEALQVYINRILGVKDSKSEAEAVLA